MGLNKNKGGVDAYRFYGMDPSNYLKNITIDTDSKEFMKKGYSKKDAVKSAEQLYALSTRKRSKKLLKSFDGYKKTTPDSKKIDVRGAEGENDIETYEPLDYDILDFTEGGNDK